MTEDKNQFMRLSIDLANSSITSGGGPFGAVVVCNGEVVGKGANSVTNLNDPTAHAEVLAIRDAAKNLGRFDLNDCVLYTSCEPCPMCLGATYWAKIKKLYYGCSRKDAAKAGFDDDFIYQELNISPEKRSIEMNRLLENDAFETFEKWINMPDKKEY
ncbi:MAG: nucleoside deaminase [Marinilabiliaceae bacterium]|nr:nucleoside deaminase [Marinilabiliaceae bacterium]